MTDIRDWTTAEISQLPDHAYGERRIVAVQAYAVANTTLGFLSVTSLPPRAMLWQVGLWSTWNNLPGSYIRLALASSVPANEAGMSATQPVLFGLGLAGAEPRKIHFASYANLGPFHLRSIMDTSGLNLCVWHVLAGTTATWWSVWLVYSAVPDYIPTWILTNPSPPKEIK